MVKKKRRAMTGAECTAEAMRQINPDVVAAYPITPQTSIMHAFSQFVADGDVDTEFITVESEHSAMSACVGSASAGARTMTATSANGLALMWEIVYVAASTRLPIVMNVVNRALSGPINIHCDHSDSMGCRDSGWIQFYSENGEEAYENTVMAVKIAEHKEVLLPVIICQDGFITSHGVETAEMLDDKTVKDFIGEYEEHYPLLDTENPVTYGPLDLFDYYFEHKKQQMDAMNNAKKIISEVFHDFGKITGKKYDFFEGYMMNDADVAILCANSTAGTLKHLIDELRAEGRKVGLLKMRVFRPWHTEQLLEKLGNAKVVAVLDRAASFGAQGGPIFSEVRSSFYDSEDKPKIINYIYGLGGREFTLDHGREIYNELERIRDSGEIEEVVKTQGVRE